MSLSKTIYHCLILVQPRKTYAQIQEFSLSIRDGGGGGVQVNLTKKSSDKFFSLVLSLFYRSQMVNFIENYPFLRFRRGFNNFQGGGVQLLIPYTNPHNLCFSRVV